MKRYNYKDDFEMVYLRPGYAKKCKNMDGELVKKHQTLIRQLVSKEYYKLRANFHKVSFEREDLISIASMYMIYYRT